MKQILITAIAAVLLVGCAVTQAPKPPTEKAPDIDIHQAATDGNIKAVKQHLAAGKDVNAKDFAGWTPLHRAAEAGQNKIVELLIDEGGDVNAKMENRWTPLDEAIAVNQTETPDLLRKHGGKTGEELKAEGK
ncbi:ankyrin repeat domain-containing protein [bacterium]|nr:ankyrin repeat domain-containing protein [bacterium]